MEEYNRHICKDGTIRNYPSIFCSMHKPGENLDIAGNLITIEDIFKYYNYMKDIEDKKNRMAEYKMCECGVQIADKDEVCQYCLSKDIGVFWSCPKNYRISMWSDGNQFVASINGGVVGETFLSVGYSCPNYAWITRDMIYKITEELNKFEIIELDLYEMLPQLLELCKIANRVYNELIWK